MVGLSDHAIEKRLQRERLIAIRRGVYAVGHAHLTAEARWLAAVWACGSTAVLSHRSAAAAWGIRPSSSPTIDVTVRSRTGRADRDGIRLHRVTRLSEDETAEGDGIPVTSWARTILDLAAVLPPRSVERALERSEQLRLFDLNQLDKSLIANAGRPGCAVLRAVLDEGRLGETLTQTKLEEAMFRLCTKSGLPRPEVNVEIGTYTADFLWREVRLIAETDGFQTHGTRAAFESDRVRDAELMLQGYRVVRFTYWRVLRHRKAVAAILRQLLTSST
ncbi:MAG: endonuclease domain-containing protein [Actinomycetota bacterium]|nr:endonuclease domain-containing protein [Actinomycetota bacterium]